MKASTTISSRKIQADGKNTASKKLWTGGKRVAFEQSRSGEVDADSGSVWTGEKSLASEWSQPDVKGSDWKQGNAIGHSLRKKLKSQKSKRKNVHLRFRTVSSDAIVAYWLFRKARRKNDLKKITAIRNRLKRYPQGVKTKKSVKLLGIRNPRAFIRYSIFGRKKGAEHVRLRRLKRRHRALRITSRYPKYFRCRVLSGKYRRSVSKKHLQSQNALYNNRHPEPTKHQGYDQYPQKQSWKADRKQSQKSKASYEKRKKEKLNKKQLKKLVSRIEYLAALCSSARNKEEDSTQGLTFSKTLLAPFARVSVKTVWNFIHSSKVIAMLTANVGQILSGLFSAFTAALSSILLPVMSIVLPIVLAIALIVALIPSFNEGTTYPGGVSQYDAYCYLTAKYESGGDAASVGADVGYLAYGEFQFYYLYELRPFIRWCHEKNPTLYQPFEAYLNMDVSQVPGEDFRNAWKAVAEKDYSAFELDQEEYICTYTLNPTLTNLKEKYGYDFENASAALKACVLSFANRSGKSVATLSRYFDGTSASSTDEEIINRAYAAMYAQRPIRRWDREHEWKDCLDQLAGTLDIYAKSENGAGGIDWSWKKSEPGRILDSTGDDIVDYALQFVGNPYVWGGDSLTGGIDCSHFIWRVLLNTGHYSGGYLTSGDWRNVGEPVASIDQAIAGDVVCYDGHVAFYDGSGYLVEAKNTREGITHDEKPDYMPIVCIRRIR